MSVDWTKKENVDKMMEFLEFTGVLEAVAERIKADEPEKPASILDEDWTAYEDDVHRPDGGTIYMIDWIAAMPDVLRSARDVYGVIEGISREEYSASDA